MKNKILNSLKKSFTYIKKHFTNFLLGTIIVILLLMWCDSSLSHKEWFVIAKAKITHPGYKYKSEVVGKVKYICNEFDLGSYLEKYKSDNAGKPTKTLEEIREYKKENESQFYKDVEKYSNVIRNRQWKFFIFKTYDQIIFSQKMGDNCKCAEIDLSTSECKWTKFAEPTPTTYLFK